MQIKEITADNRTFISFDKNHNPCADCGLCCVSYRVSFYFGECNNMPNGFVPEELCEKINDFYCCMKGTNSAIKKCIALQDNLCTIYENRPTACREFEVWDENGIPNEKCQQLRKQRGLPLLKNLVV